MKKKELYIVKDILFWSYSNLAMAHSGVVNKQTKYTKKNYMIRSRLYKGLMSGKMSIGTIFDDEKVKLSSGNKCNYCGATDNLALDHIFPKKNGGKDSGDNLIYACKTCNSSKGQKDLIEWMISKNKFPPLMILRRYLKLAINYSINNDIMEQKVSNLKTQTVPFKIELIPLKYPNPSKLEL